MLKIICNVVLYSVYCANYLYIDEVRRHERDEIKRVMFNVLMFFRFNY